MTDNPAKPGLIDTNIWLYAFDGLYSEDLQHLQLFEERLRVINPFID